MVEAAALDGVGPADQQSAVLQPTRCVRPSPLSPGRCKIVAVALSLTKGYPTYALACPSTLDTAEGPGHGNVPADVEKGGAALLALSR